MSGRTKKLLALFAAAVVLLAAIAGIFWPSSSLEPEPPIPVTTNGEANSETNPETETGTATEAGSGTATDPDTETGQQLSLTDNDRLLTETYSLTLPVSVRAREIVLETHQLTANFERANEETKEFADSTRYSCQQFESAIDPLGSGPGSETAGMLVRILESDIGLEFVDTEDDLDDNEIRIVGDLSDLQPAEIEAIVGMIQRLNQINNDSLASELRKIDCEIGDSGNNSGRNNDINLIVSNINQYAANNNGQPPEGRSDIEDLVADQLSHYSPRANQHRWQLGWRWSQLASRRQFCLGRWLRQPPATPGWDWSEWRLQQHRYHQSGPMRRPEPVAVEGAMLAKRQSFIDSRASTDPAVSRPRPGSCGSSLGVPSEFCSLQI